MQFAVTRTNLTGLPSGILGSLSETIFSDQYTLSDTIFPGQHSSTHHDVDMHPLPTAMAEYLKAMKSGGITVVAFRANTSLSPTLRMMSSPRGNGRSERNSDSRVISVMPSVYFSSHF